MDKARIIREILLSGNSLTIKQIVNTIKNEYPSEWAEKEQYYLDGGKDEVYVYNQVRAEVGSALGATRGGWIKLGRVTRQKNEEGVWVYTITPEYKNFLESEYANNQFLNEDNTELDFEENINEDIEDDCEECPKEWYVYLMKSDEFDNTYKIGYTDSLERRPKELRSPSNKVYNIFNFYVHYWVRVNSKLEMDMMEDTLHAYFHKDRKCPKNGNTIKTEIFVNPNMEKMFSEFIKRNYINDDYHKSTVVDYCLK